MACRNNLPVRWTRLAIRILALTGLAGGLAISGATAQSVDIQGLFPHLEATAWQDFAEGRLANRREFVADVVSRLGNIPDSVWQESLHRINTDLAIATRSPLEFAGQPFEFFGRVVQTAPIAAPAPEPQGGDEKNEDIWNTIIRSSDGSELEVLTPQVPRVWQKQSAAGQPVAGCGLLLMVRDSLPVLAAPRLNWSPDESNPAMHVGVGLLLLAQAGFDAGLLDNARNYSDAPITSDEYPMFQEFMRAVSRIDANPSEFSLPEMRPAVDLVQVAQDPAGVAGELFEVSGELRRITPVQVDQGSGQDTASTGDQWFQLDVFLPLGNRQVVLAGRDGQKTLRFNGSYGITVLIPSLTDEIKQSKLPLPIRIPAFFLKNWEHKTLASRQLESDIRKPNPIFVGLPRQLIHFGRNGSAKIMWLLIPVFWGGLIALLAGLVVWTRRRHPSWHSRQRQQPNLVIPGIRDGDAE